MKWYEKIDAQRLQRISSSIQSLVIAVGLIVGGIFALWKFTTLSEIQAREISMKLDEMELTRPGVVNLAVGLSPVEIPGDSSYCIRASFQLENVGAFRAKFATREIRYGTYRLGLDEYLTPIVLDSSGSRPVASQVDTLFLFPKEKISFHQLIGVPAPGLYQVVLQVYSRNVGSDLGASGADSTTGLSIWEASSFISMGGES